MGPDSALQHDLAAGALAQSADATGGTLSTPAPDEIAYDTVEVYDLQRYTVHYTAVETSAGGGGGTTGGGGGQEAHLVLGDLHAKTPNDQNGHNYVCFKNPQSICYNKDGELVASGTRGFQP